MSIWHTAKLEDISIDEKDGTVAVSFMDYGGNTHYVEVTIEAMIAALAEAGYVEVEPDAPQDAPEA